jgi:calcineurin-like phosphoesterase family protein
MFTKFPQNGVFQAENVAFTSDLHIGHDKAFIYEARGFGRIDQHDRAVEKALHSLRCEHLFIVGDVMMGSNKVERLLELFNLLPYPVSLILGNHDPSARVLEAIDPLANAQITLDDTPIAMCHFPADFVDHRGRDFSDFMPPDDGGVLIHGHTHSENKVTRSEYGTRQVHVGWDAWRRPVFGSELLALLDGVTVADHSIDH